MKSFREMTEIKDFSQDNYPYSEQGIKTFSVTIKYLIRLIIFYLCSILCLFISNLLSVETSALNKVKSQLFKMFKGFDFSIDVDYLLVGKYLLYGLFYISYFMLNLLFLLCLAIFAIYLILYLINVIKRQRCYERKVIINDFKAYTLKQRIFRNISAKAKYLDAKRDFRSKRMSDGKALTTEDRNKFDLRKEIMNLIVQINSRESLEDKGKVDTQYRLKYVLPSNSDVASQLLKEVENLNDVANRVYKSRLKFSKMFYSEDETFIVSRAMTQSQDKYHREYINQLESKKKKSKEPEKNEPKYELSYPLSLFDDLQAEIDVKSQASEQWAKRNAPRVKSLLETKNIDVIQKNVTTSSSTALYIFDMPEDVELKSFDKLGDIFDNVFGIQGSTATIEMGYLKVTLPLPAENKIPINIPTLYGEAFGGR